MQGGRRTVDLQLHGALMKTPWRSIVTALLLITITLHSPQQASANEANHKVSTTFTRALSDESASMPASRCCSLHEV